MKKLVFFFLTLLFPFLLFPSHNFDQMDYTLTQADPVSCTPEPGVYYNNITLKLSSTYGTIYYFINENLGKSEPIPYKTPLYLKGKKDFITEYRILILLKKKDGRIELINKLYRIDLTGQMKFLNQESAVSPGMEKEEKDITKLKKIIEYRFDGSTYHIRLSDNNFLFPPEVKKQSSKKEIIELTGEEDKLSNFVVSASYNKNNKIFTSYQHTSINDTTPDPPSFGSLYWGQIYRQNYKIKIKSAAEKQDIYYWIQEFPNTSFIYGAPPITEEKKWQRYQEAIRLHSEYGEEGVIGIAAYAVNEAGNVSELAGPYYLKVSELRDSFEQTFDEKKAGDPRVLFNGQELKGAIEADSMGKLEFQNFEDDRMFYFSYSNSSYQGQSDLIPCKGDYNFTNSGDNVFEISLFYETGERIGVITLKGKNFILPVLKGYRSNYVDLSHDAEFEFYMPEYTIRYNFTKNIDNYIYLDYTSPVFQGSIEVKADDGEEAFYKLKFGSFDKQGNIIAESDYYYFKVDKRYPSREITARGADFSIPHNSDQVIELVEPEENLTLYYKLHKEARWVLYEKPLEFAAPRLGMYEVPIYVKSVDRAGNEKENPLPFVLRFDRRGIFLNTSLKRSGNGTYDFPVNTLKKALELSFERDIKIIYLLEEKLQMSHQAVIKKDVILQPFRAGQRTTISAVTKSIWQKNFTWFEIPEGTYFETRNITFSVQSGSVFMNLEKSKVKLYNTKITFEGKQDFCFFTNNEGKLGIHSLTINAEKAGSGLSFLKSSGGYNLINLFSGSFKADTIDFITSTRDKLLSLNYLKLSFTANNTFTFGRINNSLTECKNLTISQKGSFVRSTIFKALDSTLKIDQAIIEVIGENSFELTFCNLDSSKAELNTVTYKGEGAGTVLGINSVNSICSFNQGMLDIKNITDYIYAFRMEKSTLEVGSSIIRNLSCENSITFSLTGSTFSGINNSIFTADCRNRGYNFWINQKAAITTVNSFYYFDRQDRNNAFMYVNNVYDLIMPVWYSNAITSNVVTIKNLFRDNSEQLIKDFEEKNIRYSFEDDFSLTSDFFFIPQKDSPLLQGGIDADKSPLAIPEEDFYGNQRILQGYGIDIGAIQKTGNLQ